MKHMLIIYHSQTGNTRQLADAAQRGALNEQEIEVRLKTASNSDLEDLLWCDGLIVASPENFGYMAGAIKDFFDRTYYPAQEYAQATQSYELNLPYLLLVSAGNDGTGAGREMDRILCGYPMKKVAEPLIARHEVTSNDLQLASDLGESLASGLVLGIF